MKYIIAIFFFVYGGTCLSQPVTQRSSDAITVMDGNLFAKNSFRPAIFADTTAANSATTLDSCGKLIYTFSDNSYWMRGCNPKRWMKLLREGDVSGTLANNGLSKTGDVIQLGGTLISSTHISGGANGFAFQLDSSSSISLFSGLEYVSSGVGSFIQMSDSVMNIGSSSATDFTSFVFSPTQIKFIAADGAGSAGNVWTNTGSGYGHWAAASAGTALNNIGSGYRWVATAGGNVKSFFTDITGSIDSTSNANALTFKVDTSLIASQFDLRYYAPLFTVDSTRKYVPLVLFVGESNAAGVLSNAGLSAGELAAFPRIQILNNQNFQLEALQIGVNNNINVNFPNGHGWELQLAKSILQDSAFLTDTVYLVKTARAGAGIQELIDSLPTAYRRIDSAILQIRRAGYYPQVYVFYSQGINDQSNDTAVWLRKTVYYIDAIRKRAGYAPYYITKIMTGSSGVNRNNTIAKLPYWDGFSYVINSQGYPTQDANHWDSTGISEICKDMLRYTRDSVQQRNLYTQTQANHLKNGYINIPLAVVDDEASISGMRLKASLANQFIGNISGYPTTGNYNTALGYQALNAITTGISNTAVGHRTLVALTTASNNLAFGERALEAITTQDNNTAFGYYAGNSTTTANNVFIGTEAARSNITGVISTAIGSQVARNSTDYSVSIGIGYGAASSRTNSFRNIDIGVNASVNGAGGDYNIVIGTEANRDNIGSTNTVIGDQALFGPTNVSGVVAIGYNVGQSVIGSNELWIDNSNTTSPLLRGYFSADSLKINGFLKTRDSLEIGKARVGTSSDSVYVKLNNGSVGVVAQSSISANGIIGTTTNNNAATGNVGEYVSSTIASGSAVSLTTATTANVTSISLTAGDWDVTGVVDYAMTSATATDFKHGTSTTSATLGAQDSYVQKPFSFAGSSSTLGDNTPTIRISIAGTTTVYLVAQATFSGGSIGAYGTIRARRVR